MGGEQQRMDRVFRERQRLAARYSLDNPGNQFNYRQLRERIEDLLHSVFSDLSAVRLLDLGAGDLFWAEEMIAMGLNRRFSVGSDLLPWRLRDGQAKGRIIDAVAASGVHLPFASDSFDLVSQFTMMTSVLDSHTRELIGQEMARVLRPGGYILWYDFRYSNPANRNARAIGKTELTRLFSGLPVGCATTTLVPQLARKVSPRFSPLLKFANKFSILRTHYLALIGPKG